MVRDGDHADWSPSRPLTPGSTAYYLARFCPPDRRADAAVLLAWQAAVDAIRRLSDGGVATAKLQWWRTEVERAAAGAATHPLAVAFGEVLARREIDTSVPVGICDALSDNLRRPGYTTAEDVAAHHRAASGALAQMLTRVAQGNDLSAAEDCGAYFGAVDVLRRLGGEIRTISPLVPRSILAAQELNAPVDTTSEAAPLVQALCHQAASLRPRSGTRLPQPVSGMMGIADALLNEVRRGGTTVLRAELDLTPLRKLWIVWRSR